ncbi:Trk family potassium uptake protein [Candidatus Cryosericum septentrionale]|uniref:Trk family potassium uptake protein n=1 Tax=Candidatus Cryosericum septentrionale TaxID=2290913 RepID=A0A398DYX8_9BACT|nr:Trk family potassium uptake protein [Candidatus Cryosericum septentrionale]
MWFLQRYTSACEKPRENLTVVPTPKQRRPTFFQQLMPTGPAERILLSFTVVILVGTFFLLLPQSNTGVHPGFLRALFTATSATCVTGLVVFDTGSFWSTSGQVVILLLIQVGGLGYMVLTTMLMATFRNSRLRVRQTGDFRESVAAPSHRDPRSFARLIASTVIICEGLGALFLSLRFLHDMPTGKAVWNGIFTSVSAFCNAGFDVLGRGMTSFETYAGDITVNLVVPVLIILGGLGFLVIDELRHHLSRTRHKRLSTHTRTVLALSAALVVGGAVLIFILESMNPGVFASLSLKERVLTSWFQSVTARTAGFNTLRLGDMHSSSLMLIIVLMFIGASPGGTGGGVKTTTFAVVAAFIWSIIIGSDQTHLGNRGIHTESVKKAVVVFALSLVVVFGGTFLLAIMDGHRFSTLGLLFEVTSAFGTVGLSTGITPTLSAGSKIVLIATMLAGRVGVLTAMLTLLAPVHKFERRVHFAEDDVAIG